MAASSSQAVAGATIPVSLRASLADIRATARDVGVVPSGEQTPPPKAREEVLRAVWGAQGEPGAPLRRGMTKRRRRQCSPGEIPEVAMASSPKPAWLEDRFSGCRDVESSAASSSVGESAPKVTSRAADEAQELTASCSTTPVRRRRPPAFEVTGPAEVTVAGLTPAKPRRTGIQAGQPVASKGVGHCR